MKLTTKLVAASLFALSAVVPALAVEPEAAQLEERNTFLYTADARPIALAQQKVSMGAHHAVQAFAYAPNNGGIVHHGEFDGY